MKIAAMQNVYLITLCGKIVIKMEQPEMIHKKLKATRGSEVQGLRKTLPSPLLPFFPLSLPAQLLSLFLSEALVCSSG